MTEHTSIVIVGTGFAGLATAIQLKKRGTHDFVVLERASDVGGVWRDNTYPGCACDVESHLYSLSFVPNPRWTRKFSPQPEIWEYLRDCADRFGIRPHIHFETLLEEARWDEKAQKWSIKTPAGEIIAPVLISGAGALSEPAIPNLPGLGRFQGKTFHSANWDHDYDLTGRRVAVIGTGASSIQFVPHIQPQVAQLDLYQRSAPWIVPRGDRPLAPRERAWAEKIPLYRKLLRQRHFWAREFFGRAFRRRFLMAGGRLIARQHLKRSVRDPELRRKLTPSYEMGCKRILLSDDFYPAVSQENVAVVTDGIREVRPHGIVTTAGSERPCEAIIFGTGFQVTEPPFARRIFNGRGERLAEAMAPSPKAFLGTTFPGFPNLFVLQGPNTGLGHSSVVMMTEYQITHVLKALAYMRRQGVAAITPKPQALERFVDYVDRKMAGTVWVNGGCGSWYLDKTGRNAALWPTSVTDFGRHLKRFRPEDYDVTVRPINSRGGT